jgi:hypothetical protein
VTDQNIENKLNSLFDDSGNQVNVAVSSFQISELISFTVTFTSPVGNAPTLSVLSCTVALNISNDQYPYLERLIASNYSDLNFSSIIVTEVIQGISPIAGTFTIYFEGYYTSDIHSVPYDASPSEMKSALDSLPSIGKVQVEREYNRNGFMWTVYFSQNVGDLRLLDASSFRYEVQRIFTSGGYPTPLSGYIDISFLGQTVTVSFDVSDSDLKSALERIPSIGSVEVEGSVSSYGQRSWTITLRNINKPKGSLIVSDSKLYGSNALVSVQLVVSGTDASLTGKKSSIASL